MIKMIDNTNDVLQLKDRLYKRLQHPYLIKFIEPPLVDEDKFFFLYTMLQEQKISDQRLHEYVLTTMLVQAALDTHEKVSLTTISTNVVKKNRQLTVLAGDYYSSLYYYLLANIDDITMISLLASSIQEINESKMNFYKSENRSLQCAFNDVRMIESDLLQTIADHYKLTNWKEIISEFFFLKRLLTERKIFEKGEGYSPLADKMLLEHFQDSQKKGKNRMFQQEQLEQLLQMWDVYIDHSITILLKLLEPHKQLQRYVSKRLEKLYLDTGFIKEKVAEEG